MIVWCMKPELTILSDIAPCTAVRKPLPSDTKEEKEDKRKFPYLNKKDVTFRVNYLGVEYIIFIERGFKWDGTTALGLHHLPKFLNGSMVHDVLCSKHYLVANDRQLSTIIFRELCIASGVNKFFAYLAYYAVDIFQKFFGIDENGRKWNEF